MKKELAKSLLYIARAAIAGELGIPVGASPLASGDVEALLAEPGAVFVTLTLDGELRGCIGSLRPVRSLGEDCAENAKAAAFSDPRFSPLRGDEFGRIVLQISVLGSALPFACEGEDDACERLRPGEDGVILSYQGHRATFLPQVWEQLPEPHAFLAALKRKAGLPERFWSPELSLAVYSVDACSEKAAA